MIVEHSKKYPWNYMDWLLAVGLYETYEVKYASFYSTSGEGEGEGEGE